MARISVARRGSGDPMSFSVTVADGGGSTKHEVTVAAAHRDRLAPDAEPEVLVQAAFRFLLDREPKESIMARFDLAVISRYFPEFEKELSGYLERG